MKQNFLPFVYCDDANMSAPDRFEFRRTIINYILSYSRIPFSKSI